MAGTVEDTTRNKRVCLDVRSNHLRRQSMTSFDGAILPTPPATDPGSAPGAVSGRRGHPCG
jgi:hypothetical protein